MIVLGIESSCDETACAIVCDGKKILSNIISSQMAMHTDFGGVVPELASRMHVDAMIPVIESALTEAGITLDQVDLIAVAQGPGLIGSLLIGLNTAKALALALQRPFIGVNHVQAHLYASLMSHQEVKFPCLGVVLSGGHTALLMMEDFHTYTLIGQTADDAIGEAFDKVAKLLGLPYPGGPHVEDLAREGYPHSYPFKAGYLKGRPFDFSFSGLKTAVLYAIQNRKLDEKDKRNVAASFQRAAFSDVIDKSLLAAQRFNCSSLLFGGGVTNSLSLRSLFAQAAPHLDLKWPTKDLTLDNAAMIAGLGYATYLSKGPSSFSTEPYTRGII